MFFEHLLSAFPDFRYEIVQQHQDGDMHIGWIRGTGTMKGDFMGMPASGQTATWDEVHFGRVVNGTVQEHWAVIDQFSMLRQLGFIPETGGG
ncbi:MAG TPA: ester cyclase [Acidimicrobiales bacterium]|nr:ester cyclase [Acidimicrobiales bacterium]